MNRILAFLFTILISGCNTENDNRIGLEMSVGFYASTNCMRSVVVESDNVNHLTLTGKIFSFTLKKYNVKLIVEEQRKQKTENKF